MKILKFSFAILIVVFSHAVIAEEYHSTCSIDITGDKSEELITYKVKKKDENYDGSLIIKTINDRILWEHEYQMSYSDLFNDLLMNEGNISLEHWVKHFFDGSLMYGAKS